MARELFALDVETAATDKKYANFAGLEPFRVLQGKGHITSVSLARPGASVVSLIRRKLGDEVFKQELVNMIQSLDGCIVYAHNAVFDLGWLIASIRESRTAPVPEMFRRVKWHDTMLLAKWIVNGQKADDMRFSLSLVNLVKSFLRLHPLTDEFVKLKTTKVEAFGNDEYWESRNEYDVVLTQALAEMLESKLPEGQRKGYATEMRNLLPVANSWITGIRIDTAKLDAVEKSFKEEQSAIIKDIQISPDVMTSPKQLGYLLFTKLGLSPESYTPTGTASTSADDLKMIAFKLNQAGNEELGKVMKKILRYKQIATLMSKYVKGTRNALEHTGDGYIYGAPRIFGTYTGRFTYSSKTLDTYQTGIAFHQIPRQDQTIRGFLCPPTGYRVYEADASGQESRLMAIKSNDESMLRVFSEGLNFHAMTGANIIGMEYDDFMEKYLSGDLVANEQRQFGKLTNLSCNYRIGGKALSKKAFSDYDQLISIEKGMFFVNTFIRSYPGVATYWEDAIKFARVNGYSETFGGRRYKIHDWSQTRRWESESAAINNPIQGSGAAQKNIIIAETFDKVPDAIFFLDLHDASFFWVPEYRAEECKKELDKVLEDVDYSQYWGFTPPIALSFESKMGASLADVK